MFCLCKTVDHMTRNYGTDKLGALLSLKKFSPVYGSSKDYEGRTVYTREINGRKYQNPRLGKNDSVNKCAVY